jgi:hypothetical protein
MLSYLNVMVKPLDNLYNELLYKMQHDCSVISLEKMLNEYFKVANYDHQNHEATKQVYIEDEIYPPENYIYTQNEFRPAVDYDNNDFWLDEDNIYLEDDVNYFDFVIFIPEDFIFEIAQLKATIDYYKLAAKKYRIELY